VHKAGGAYVPLDPTYPRDRIGFMIEDAAMPVLLTQERLVADLPASNATIVPLDATWAEIDALPDSDLRLPLAPSNLAYVIYTSGSTGKPKGVMVEHGNVVNFFAGMDERIDSDSPGVWLAVTSLSFDISVLELLWTLARGFTVVLYTGDAAGLVTPSAADVPVTKPLSFSLFYFASDQGDGGGDTYRLLLEGARFADRHGFEAVWTPERHFHSFGGLYPNPSVTAAAVAAVTERVKVRAGSVVLPLHSPIRVAEEWSVVDNLSRGRAGLSIASGWQPNDFVLKPENFANAKRVMVQEIETVRRLWRGEAVAFPGPVGGPVEVRILPRPVQPELPVWVTAAGNPETFRLAGEMGANILTHLLGQSVEEVAEKIAVYRQAWREHGHRGEGRVTLMLHTFVGDDEAAVREIVRGPMKEYLRSSVGLIKGVAWSFPIFKNRAGTMSEDELLSSLSDEEMDALLDYSFERYYETSGLFGTPQRCIEIAERMRAIGVDEIGCLIDFGVETETVLKSLERLNAVRLTTSEVAAEMEDISIPALIARHGVTHLQCTPSMATMLLADQRARMSLRSLRQMMIGGEAFPSALAAELTGLVSGAVTNMYGPTETTIWSSTHPVEGTPASIPIGRPIANTQMYIVDRAGQPAPVGVPGELLIGGDGVVRGYLNRPELTVERFLPNCFVDDTDARVYRTGDLARYLPDGTIEFLGRLDHQVKIRGYRIELGEIESVLNEQEGVREAVVIAREDTPGATRLVAYVVTEPGQTLSAECLRAPLEEALPDYMVPAQIVFLDRFPLTPNAKIDRKALPRPDELAPATIGDSAPPSGAAEETVAAIWREVLNLPAVGREDNFFDLGGHSLLAVQVHRRLTEQIGPRLTLTDLFRFPTVRAVADFLEQGNVGSAVQTQSTARAEARQDALARRRQRVLSARA
jgi:natural product biosynthesis luciferase-like monooxygenase protein